MDLMEEQWDEISLEGILSFSFGTFFNVIPKLVLISWTFSVLNWNMWLIFIPLFMISECISFKINEDLKEEGIKYYGKRLFTSIQVMFGYSGWKGTIFSAFLMACFLIPLSISLHAAVNTSEQVDYFSVFPSDPFPSCTICFTNSSRIEQQKIWNNETTTFSKNCIMTYSAVLCDQGLESGQRNIIVVQLALMIIMVSLLLTVIVPCTIWAVACIWIGAVGSTRISASPVYILGLAALGMFMYLGLAALGTF